MYTKKVSINYPNVSFCVSLSCYDHRFCSRKDHTSKVSRQYVSGRVVLNWISTQLKNDASIFRF